MKLFGKRRDPNDPVPEGVQLTGKIKEEPIVLSKLTEIIIRQDLTSIRDIFVHVNEKLGTVVGFGDYLTAIENLVIRFGKAYENLIQRVNLVIEQVSDATKQTEQCNRRLETKYQKVLERQDKIIESQNQVINSLNGFFQVIKQKRGNSETFSLLTLIDVSEESVPANQQSEDADTEIELLPEHSKQSDNSNKQSQSGINQTKDNADPDVNSEFSEEAEGDSTEPINPETQINKILSEVENAIADINKNYPSANLKTEFRNAENLPGRQIKNLWFIAVPPHSDGSYDPRNLQDDAYRKIKNTLAKNEATIMIAVYDGVIKPKHLAGARSSAETQRIVLCSREQIGITLGLLKIKYNGQSFVKEQEQIQTPNN